MAYQVYRDGSGSIEARVKAAVTGFYQARRELPARVVVNPTERNKAQAACKALALKVPVETTGGCLIPEVWLQLPPKEVATCQRQG